MAKRGRPFMAKRGRRIETHKLPKLIVQNVLIEPEQVAYLEQMTKINGISKAEIVRQSLSIWMLAHSVLKISRGKSLLKPSQAEGVSCVFYLEPEQVDYLNRIAQATTISKSTVVREALRAWMLANPLPLSASESED